MKVIRVATAYIISKFRLSHRPESKDHGNTVKSSLIPAGINKLEVFSDPVLVSKMRVLFKKRGLFESDD